jgi:WD40 repeat protein
VAESRRAEAARLDKERQQLAEIAAAQANIATEQARTARSQRITRWAFAAVGAIIVIAGAAVGYLQWDKARQLATKETEIAAEQASNAALRQSLNARQIALDHAQASFIGQLSETKLSRADIDGALRLASLGTSIDLALPSDAVNASMATAALAAAVSRADWRFVLCHDSPIHYAIFSPDASRIVTTSMDGIARIWNAATGKQMAVLRGHDGVWSAAFSPDGSRIVTASADKTARSWDAATTKEIVVLRGHDAECCLPPSALTGRVSSQRQATATPVSGTSRPPKRSQFCVVTTTACCQPPLTPMDLASSPQDTTTTPSGTLTPHKSAACAVMNSPCNPPPSPRWSMYRHRVMGPHRASQIATGTDDRPATTIIELRRLQPKIGSRIVTVRRSAVLRGHDLFVDSAAFSADGSRIVTASSDSTARIWDAATGKEIATLRGHDRNVFFAAYSPDGRRIVSASADKTARIWDAATAKEIAVLRGHDDTLMPPSAAFSPGGSHIVTASWDKTARIWDATTAKEIRVLRGHSGPADSLLLLLTVRRSSRRHVTIPRAYGTLSQIGRSLSCLATRASYRLPLSALTGRASSPRQTITPPASGTRKPQRRSQSCAVMAVA